MSHPLISARVPGAAREAPQLSHKCSKSLPPISWVWSSTHLGGSAPTWETQHPPGRLSTQGRQGLAVAACASHMALMRGAPAHLRDVTAMLGSVGCRSHLPFFPFLYLFKMYKGC